jgi:hypothetical protein
VTSLSKRLELLERQIVNGGYRSESEPELNQTPSTSTSAIAPDSSEHDILTSSSLSPGNHVSDNGKDSWVYQMASDTQRQFQTQATPASTPTPQIDTDMSALNDALEDLGKLKSRADLTRGKASLEIQSDEARQCLEVFFETMNTLVLPNLFASAVDLDLLRSLPNIIGSPYVVLDPGVHVMYYAGLHEGLTQIRGPGHAMTQAAYLKALEHVPAWLEGSTETDMDVYTAALISWTAITNLDYQLAWRFHLKACYTLKSKGIDVLDVSPASTFEDEEKKDAPRYIFWHILSMDCLFRLFWGKPTTVSALTCRITDK